MNLYDEEPAVTTWVELSDDQLVVTVRSLLATDARTLILIDGRSGGGKTTFSGHLAVLMGAQVVHTDDIAWHHDSFDWADLLVANVIEPWSRGLDISYRPPGWIAHSRPGTIELSGDDIVLIVEGVGSGRAQLAELSDLACWVQSDRVEARRRGIARDAAFGDDATEFWDEWMRAEEPFLAADRPWTRANLVINGTPPTAAASTLVSTGPLHSI